jgi:polysaccharide export outer membrane protein
MKILISISILSLFVVCSVIGISAQTKSASPKPKTSPVDRLKNPTSALRTATPTPTASDESTVKINDPITEPSAGIAPLTLIYRVGVGDILDIRLLNSANPGRSTLFTVVPGGMIDFPVVGGPIIVAGLTTDEIRSRIAGELKRRAVEERAQISVGVRQYVSHSVMVTGLVDSPGPRVLRREEVPLYVVLAESQLRNDAGHVVILRDGLTVQTLNLIDPLALNTTVSSGDLITITRRAQEFYYIGGRITYAGQKNFQTGITLLQAILAAGGTSRQNDSSVEISREGADGHLVTTRFNLKEIKAGKVEDPKLQPGDRIDVLH